MATDAVNENWRIPGKLWERIEPLLPAECPKAKGGRPRMPNRQAMDAVFYVLRTGCQGKALPHSLAVVSEEHFASSKGRCLAGRTSRERGIGFCLMRPLAVIGTGAV
jgi:transposase